MGTTRLVLLILSGLVGHHKTGKSGNNKTTASCPYSNWVLRVSLPVLLSGPFTMELKDKGGENVIL